MRSPATDLPVPETPPKQPSHESHLPRLFVLILLPSGCCSLMAARSVPAHLHTSMPTCRPCTTVVTLLKISQVPPLLALGLYSSAPVP